MSIPESMTQLDELMELRDLILRMPDALKAQAALVKELEAKYQDACERLMKSQINESELEAQLEAFDGDAQWNAAIDAALAKLDGDMDSEMRSYAQHFAAAILSLKRG